MRQRRNKRQRAERSGRWAEHIASTFLFLTGWQALGHRVRTPVGEIDLIARRGEQIAFIEVKYRRTRSIALDAVNGKQKERILRAGALWVGQNPQFAQFGRQFDLIALSPWRLPVRIENAFYAENTRQEQLI